ALVSAVSALAGLGELARRMAGTSPPGSGTRAGPAGPADPGGGTDGDGDEPRAQRIPASRPPRRAPAPRLSRGWRARFRGGVPSPASPEPATTTPRPPRSEHRRCRGADHRGRDQGTGSTTGAERTDHVLLPRRRRTAAREQAGPRP